MVELDNADGDVAEDPDDDRHEVDEAAEARDDAHLEEVADGCGCTEIWEHLSEQRDD